MQTSPLLEPAATLTKGCYLYAIIDAATDQEFAEPGMEDQPVYAISDGRVAAVVSDLPNRRLRPERRRLAAHHAVLKRLGQEYTVLPMAFGLIADNPQAIARILQRNGSTLHQQLRRLAGKVEMGLHVVWDVPNIFEFFVNTQTELRQLRDELFRGSREPSHEAKIELGRTFDRLISEARASFTERVTQVLADTCCEIKVNKPRHEREVMNLACLVNRKAQKDFEEGIFAAAKLFDNHYAFDFNGPWPPHNFVDVQLQLDE